MLTFGGAATNLWEVPVVIPVLLQGRVIRLWEVVRLGAEADADSVAVEKIPGAGVLNIWTALDVFPRRVLKAFNERLVGPRVILCLRVHRPDSFNLLNASKAVEVLLEDSRLSVAINAVFLLFEDIAVLADIDGEPCTLK